jgi:hypothetical protein
MRSVCSGSTRRSSRRSRAAISAALCRAWRSSLLFRASIAAISCEAHACESRQQNSLALRDELPGTYSEILVWPSHQYRQL